MAHFWNSGIPDSASPAAALPRKPPIQKKKCRIELFQKLFRQNRCTKRHFSEFETPRSKTQHFPKKVTFGAQIRYFPPFWPISHVRRMWAKKSQKWLFSSQKIEESKKIFRQWPTFAGKPHLAQPGGQKRHFWSIFGDFGHFQDFSHVKVPFWHFWPFLAISGGSWILNQA